MSRSLCRNCEASVSSGALVCPECGHAGPVLRQAGAWGALLLVGVVLLAATFVFLPLQYRVEPIQTSTGITLGSEEPWRWDWVWQREPLVRQAGGVKERQGDFVYWTVLAPEQLGVLVLIAIGAVLLRRHRRRFRAD